MIAPPSAHQSGLARALPGLTIIAPEAFGATGKGTRHEA
jgi:hypothetical protein